MRGQDRSHDDAHLFVKFRRKFEGFEQLGLLVREARVLFGRCTLEESRVHVVCARVKACTTKPEEEARSASALAERRGPPRLSPSRPLFDSFPFAVILAQNLRMCWSRRCGFFLLNAPL